MDKSQYLLNLFNSNEGIIIISILWGLGMAAALRNICEGRLCYIVKLHTEENIDKNNFIYNDKCYKYIKKEEICYK